MINDVADLADSRGLSNSEYVGTGSHHQDNRNSSKLQQQLLHSLNQFDLSELQSYAYRRLGRMGLNGEDAQDVLHDAVLAVLRGGVNDAIGRHARTVDLATKSSFKSYLRGVVDSLVEGRRRKLNSRLLPDLDTLPPDTCQFPAFVSLEVRDLASEIFKRVRAAAPPHLHAALEQWELDYFWLDRIPARSRRHRAELKALARSAFPELLDNAWRSDNAGSRHHYQDPLTTRK